MTRQNPETSRRIHVRTHVHRLSTTHRIFNFLLFWNIPEGTLTKALPARLLQGNTEYRRIQENTGEYRRIQENTYRVRTYICKQRKLSTMDSVGTGNQCTIQRFPLFRGYFLT